MPARRRRRRGSRPRPASSPCSGRRQVDALGQHVEQRHRDDDAFAGQRDQAVGSAYGTPRFVDSRSIRWLRSSCRSRIATTARTGAGHSSRERLSSPPGLSCSGPTCSRYGQRVDRAAALVPAGCGPDLEVQVAAGGVAGLADDADRLAGADGVAGLQRRGFGQVHVDEVVGGALAVDDDVVAGGALEAGVLDAAAAGGDERRAAAGHHVLALVGVAGAGGAEAAGAEAEFVGAEQREGVAVEGEAEAERRPRWWPCGRAGARPACGPIRKL